MKKENKGNLKIILRLALIGVICLALVLILGYIFSLTGLDQLSEEQIQEIVAACGPWAPIAYIIVTFLQVTFIPVPFVVTILAGNLLFGFWGSFFYSLIGTVLGSVFAFVLGRRIGRPFVNWAFGDAEAVERYLSKAKGKEFVVFFFMFLLPFFPDDALCALAGITDLSNRQFAFILAISRPITVLGNLILWTGEVIPYNAWGIALMLLAIAITVASFLLSMKYADKITELFDRMTDNLAVLLRQKKDEIIEHIQEKKEEIIEHIHERAASHVTAQDAEADASANEAVPPIPESDITLGITAEFPEELRLHPSYEEQTPTLVASLNEVTPPQSEPNTPPEDAVSEEFRLPLFYVESASTTDALRAEPTLLSHTDLTKPEHTYEAPDVELYLPASDATMLPEHENSEPLAVASVAVQEG